MGRFKTNEEKDGGKHDDLIRFEARTVPGNSAKLEKLDDHARVQFYNAVTKRPRETGKGKTGLEL